MAFDSALPEEFAGNSNIDSPVGHFDPANCSPDDSSSQVSLQSEWEEAVENSLAPRATVAPRASLQHEILALRHQLVVLQRSNKKQLQLRASDRLLWVLLS